MKRMHLFCFGLSVCFCFFVALTEAAAGTCDQWTATLVSVQGAVEARKAGAEQWQATKLNDTYCPGDEIRTLARSRADIALSNQSVLRLNENSTITLESIKEEKTSVVDLIKGAAHFFSRAPRSLEVRTPYMVAGVRGTEFVIGVEDDKTVLSLFKGAVLAANDAGSLMLKSGQSAVAEAGKAPVIKTVARPRDAVTWALYYPPVIYVYPDEITDETEWQAKVRESAEFYLKGDLQKAFESIQGVPDDIRDPRFFTFRASLLLAVGRADEAKKNIERALALDQDHSDALALQSIMAVVGNDKDAALKYAERAVETGPNAATARIALSYARQSAFDLEGARTSLEEAVRLEPKNALARARLAEIRLSFGELDNAKEAAEKAVKLNPNLARTQTVLGFAHLTQIEIKEAKVAFAKAIELDQADSLPRLGLGLAKIRDGDLEEGRRDVEIAASLDPNNALIRSYLGKAYYEEKRTELDGREYEVAKELDPQDPTPWFYDAIRKQTTNRPVEALRDLQKATELNDNRAVYRSRLLLDSDQAARSASLARIYSDLGFQQRALAEGYRSVNTDMSNHSAHRFLADSYSVLPRHEIARVSELLQSQLLQPNNITPIQPHLAESGLYLISSGGPGSASFNEYNPLFNRDRVALQAGGFAGENDTYAGEGIVAGIHKGASYSAGYSHFETEGFRVNNDQKDDIVNAFLQLELSYKTSVQFEYRYRETERGDSQLRFFEDDFLPNYRQEDETTNGRLGFRHAFTPGSILLGNFAVQDAKRDLRDEPDDPVLQLFEVKGNDAGGNLELQHLFRSRYANLTTGAGYFKVDSTDNLRQDVIMPMPPPTGPPTLVSMQRTVDRDVSHTNLYLYSNIFLPAKVTLTLGASGDFFDSDVTNTDQFNPKLGITWEPTATTTVRAAAFRMLKRTLITNQTLEPTQVAGFNQFFDDTNATDAWRYGAAVDQKFTQNIYGGIEFSKRDLEVPYLALPDPPAPPIPELTTADWEEYLGRAYLYWTPHEWIGLRAEYLCERFRREYDYALGVKEVDTYRVPLGLNFFHPSGLTLVFQGSYFHQEGEFLRQGVQPLPQNFIFGKDTFWLLDAALSYRLPKRYGFVSFGVKNMLDEAFQYYDTDIENPTIQPARMIYGKVTLAIP